MSFEAEKEISRLWRALHVSQSEIGRNYFRWRHVAVELFANDDIKALDIVLRAAEYCGKDVGKTLLPKLNWLKGEKGFLDSLGRFLANLWIIDGGLATVEESHEKGEIIIKCTRDPWPTWAKEYNVSMKELVLCREKFLSAILEDVSVFFNIQLGIKIEKAIPRGDGLWLIKLYKKNK